MGEQICKTPIIANGPNDRRVWFHNPHGFYTSKVGHDILPTYEKISTIRREFKSECPRCGACSETLIHALKDCPIAHEILVLGGLNNNLLVGDYIQCIDWVEYVTRVLDQKVSSNFITTLWNSWNNRNNLYFQGKEEEAKVVWERVVTLCHDFRIHNLLNKPLLPVITAEKKWAKPPYDTLKINFDATVLMKKMGYGMLARDSDGFVLGGGASVIDTDK
ncbi:uncharacterized protein [Gossypium hirsutum]|uniref:Reverse transcriptase zinc-binding domain-containing protein n=1 Tax=Gossypium hirsutum TaxID=3635 RepID=A0ABM2ZNS5_GOSHI|nr:uncharacterized protein LOC121214551 [Gossypium hirsutum]